jgi:hypothetical protein
MKLAEMCSLLLECVAGTLVSPDLGLEYDILLKVEGFIDEHGEQLILEEKVLFLYVKNTARVWVLVGSEVVGLNSVAATAH